MNNKNGRAMTAKKNKSSANYTRWPRRRSLKNAIVKFSMAGVIPFSVAEYLLFVGGLQNE
jgi:hypothetical protein